jgi:hypothetical protein
MLPPAKALLLKEKMKKPIKKSINNLLIRLQIMNISSLRSVEV